MSTFRVGVQLHPQHTTIDDLRTAWQTADEMGLDSVWTWDHFFPLYGDDTGPHFEGWSLLAAMAVTTSRVRFGMLVTGNTYRNADLLADMARTVDHLSGGRLYLGMGAGWFAKDYEEYGYEFGTPGSRLRALETSLERVKARLEHLTPPPVGDLPILVGGGGEKVTLRLVAQFADAWNTFGPPENYAHKNEVLNQWCVDLDRDPSEIERTVAIQPSEVDDHQRYLDAGATHLILMMGHPYDLEPAERLLKFASGA